MSGSCDEPRLHGSLPAPAYPLITIMGGGGLPSQGAGERAAMSLHNFISAEDQMRAARAVLDKAPEGPGRQEARQWYQAARLALARHDDVGCLTALDAVLRALA